MPRRAELTISKRTADGLAVEGRDAVFWDRELAGFGVRVYPSGRKIYVVQSRGPGGSKRITLGRHGELTVEQARVYGKLAVAALGREHVAGLHYRLRKTPTAANNAIGALSRMLDQAEAWGLVPRGGNPCRAVAKYRTRRLERFLTEEEFRRLGQVLDTLEAEGRLPVHAAAALRLLMLTGCRCGEITTLRWEDVDLEAKEIRLRDSKTGPRVVPLSPGAARVLADLPRDAGNPWVIAGRKPGSRLSHIVYYWYRVRERAELDDVRIHDLRHSFASRALALGESLPTIGKLLGHSKIQTTARYAHLARDSVQESAARVAASIGADILP